MKKEESAWLLDAEVRYKVTPRKGRWEVSLVFINTQNPIQFLIKTIGDYHTERLAEIYGRSMQQTASKDQRGTQKINKDAYDFNEN